MVIARTQPKDWFDKKVLLQLRGLPVTKVARSTGSILLLHLGSLVDVTYPNGKSGKHGSWGIFVGPCQWQLTSKDQVKCLNETDTKTIDLEIERLVGRHIHDAKFLDPESPLDSNYITSETDDEYTPLRGWLDLQIDFDFEYRLTLYTRSLQSPGHQFSIWNHSKTLLSVEAKIGLSSDAEEWNGKFLDGESYYSPPDL